MTKHLIFFVHGMGNFNKDWLEKSEIPTLLKEKWNNYAKLKDLGTFGQNFECIGVYYNDIFEDLIASWDKMVQYLGKGITDAGISASRFHLDDFMDTVSETNRDNFITTHLLDVALYYFIKEIRAHVTGRVKEQILKRLLTENPSERHSFSIVAHSLGTAVIHDALQSLYTGEDALNPSIARPRVLVQISNVSRLLQTDSNPYTSVVHPSLNSWEGACDTFINVSHKFDPFLIPMPFEVSDMKNNLEPVNRPFVKEIEIFRVTKRNVHDLGHYLNNPIVHEALFEGLRYWGDISDQERETALEAYQKTTLQDGANTLITILEGLDIKSVKSWNDLFTAFKDFFEKVG